MTPQELKASILQLAIQGKLVEQRAEEGTAEELYQQIQNEKQRLIKAGILKKEKPYQQIVPEDCPFDIPSTWVWVYLGQICSIRTGKKDANFGTPNGAYAFDLPESWTMIELNQLFAFVDYRGKTPNKTDKGVFLITASNIKKAYMDYTRKEYISHEEYEGRQSRGLTQKGDLLFTTEAPMGNAALCDLDVCSCGQRIITFKEYEKETALPKLFMYFILSPQFQQQLLDNCTGTTAKGIKADKLKHFLIPLPPYAEQKRIVARLEEILPLCERLK